MILLRQVGGHFALAFPLEADANLSGAQGRGAVR